MPMSYSPKAGLAFIPTIDKGAILASTTEFTFRRRRIYQGVDFGGEHEIVETLTGKTTRDHKTLASIRPDT
jgi:hypothetical protein